MNFDFSEEQEMLRDQARKFLQQHSAPESVRKVLDSDFTHDQALWQGLAEMGFIGAAIPEEYGGVGYGYLELCVIAEELGRALAAVPFSSTIYLATEALLLAGTSEQKAHWLPRIASGELIATYAAAEGDGPVTAANVASRVIEGRLTGCKKPVADGECAAMAVVLAKADSGEELAVYIVDLTAEGVMRTRLKGLDESRKQAQIEFENAPAELLVPAAQTDAFVARLMSRAAVLFSFEQLGGSDRALEMAVEYARERYAFGRPIGSFQAIKHKLADMYVENQLARSNCYYAAWALYNDNDELPLAAATARVSAIKAYFLASKENVQTHGGMGFSWELDAHLFYRRAKLLSLVIGSERYWKARVMQLLAADKPA